MNKPAKYCSALCAILLATLCAMPAQAEDPIPTSVDTANVDGYLGAWRLAIDVMGNEIVMYLNLSDVEGKLGATLDSERQPEPLAITQIEQVDGRLDMNSELTFGGSFTIDININVKLTDGLLVGSIRDKGGIFTSDIAGEKATEEELGDVQGKRPDPTEARMTLADGKRIRIQFADLEQGSSDWDLFEKVEAGEVYEFTLSRATKIYTDFDLQFGDTVLKKENVAKDYPGVYSVWLKKTAGGWSLVFNNRPDIWGTRHEAQFDAIEVPLQVSEVNGDAAAKFLVTLEGDGETGVMRMAWGSTQWSADFSIVQ